MAGYKVLQGSMLDILPTLEGNSFDSCVTDPPYELNFMGKGWDNSGIAFNPETWKQVYRVLKPGAYLLAFGGSRTFHRIAVAIEDAGFEIRDTMMWLYGSGFPKSHNIGLAVDKLNGVESKVISTMDAPDLHDIGVKQKALGNGHIQSFGQIENAERMQYEIKEAQNEWKGWGTALKPAFEPIIVARKPIAEKSIAENCLKWGVGGINIDECRVGNDEISYQPTDLTQAHGNSLGKAGTHTPKIKDAEPITHVGRFPANIITDGSDEVAKGFPNSKSSSAERHNNNESHNNKVCYGKYNNVSYGFDDEGSAMRYFYTAKASKKDRDEGLDMFEEKQAKELLNREEGSDGAGSHKKNIHPTVKPTSLMQYLIRLVTPKGGHILEPFAGSGSTGKAAMFENRERNANYDITMIEMTEEYIPIIEARCEFAKNYKEEEEKPDKYETISLF